HPFLALYALEASCFLAALLAAVRGHTVKVDYLFALGATIVLGTYTTWIWFSPASEKNMRIGYGQPFVNYDCTEEVESSTWGLLSRGKFLCPQRMRDDLSFTFDCLQSLPPDYSNWYWACGVRAPDGVTDMLNYLLLRSVVGFVSLRVYSLTYHSFIVSGCVTPVPMASTFPVWSQLAYLIFCLIALVGIAIATWLRKYIPSFLHRPCTGPFPSRAIALSGIVVMLALLVPTVIQLVTYPSKELIVTFCIVIGRLSAWAMSISLFLSLRPVANIFKIGFERIAVLHGILGILGLLAGIVHGVLPFYFKSSAAKIFARGGLEATIGCGLILLSLLFAIVYRWLPHGYRLFRLTHWLVYVASALIAYHLYLRDDHFAAHYSAASRTSSGVFIVCLCLSFMERLVELYSAIRQWYHTRRSVTDSAEDSKPLPYCCRIESVKPLADDTKGLPKACQLTIRCPLKLVPGQWVSLFFPGMDAIGHPYSVLPPLPGAEHEQRFLISGKG
ncbi:hypothetical protein FOZ62_003454, partial [Perkinsus olseni]